MRAVVTHYRVGQIRTIARGKVDELTIEQAAALLGVHPGSVRKAIQQGRLKSRKVGKRLNLLDPDEVARYGATQKHAGGRPKQVDTPNAAPAPIQVGTTPEENRTILGKAELQDHAEAINRLYKESDELRAKISESLAGLNIVQLEQLGKHAEDSTGHALLEIKEKRLYRGEFRSFAEYCRNRWDLTVAEANRFIAAAQ